MSQPRPSTDNENSPLLEPSQVQDDSNAPVDSVVIDHTFDDDIPERNLNPFHTRKLSILEQILFASTILFLILASIFIGLYAGEVAHGKPSKGPFTSIKTVTTTTTQIQITSSPPNQPTSIPIPDNICLRPECVVTAAKVIADMDTSVDPCDDFFSYACGGYIQKNTIPDDKEYSMNFMDTDKRNRDILKGILESEFEETKFYLPDVNEIIDRQNFYKMKSYYNSCMDMEKLNNIGVRPLQELLFQVIHRFPIHRLDKVEDLHNLGNFWKKSLELDQISSIPGRGPRPIPVEKQHLTETISYLSSIDVSPMIGILSLPDDAHPQKNVLNILQGSFGLPARELYKEEKILALYEQTISEMFSIVLDGNKNLGRYDYISKVIVNFEKKLNSFRPSALESYDVIYTYNPYNLSQLTDLFPIIDWKDLFSAITPWAISDPIIIHSPSFMGNLSEIISNTSAEFVQAYMVWVTIKKYSLYLGDELNQPIRKLGNILAGLEEDTKKKRWDICQTQINSHLGLILGRWFIAKKFSPEAKRRGNQLLQGIKDAFIKRVDKLTWMDKETAEKAKEKARKIYVDVGYPLMTPNTTSPISLASYYRQVEVISGQFFNSTLSANRAEKSRMFSRVGRSSQRDLWEMNPQEVNAYYDPSMNKIVIPAGILQDPFFDLEFPDYLSFGAIGMVSGHELTHGFDNNGRLYDKDGNLRNWWSNETSEKFKKQSNCYIDQYSNYSVIDKEGKEHFVNGSLTLGENLADNSGLQEAFDAWKFQQHNSNSNSNSNSNTDFLLPGLEKLSREQLFFIAAARPWCSITRPEYLVNQVRNDPHSPAKFRILGPMMNNRVFAKSFNCPIGSKMNPVKKCEMW